MTARGRFQGVGAIVRFNWPFYLVAGAVILILALGLYFSADGWIKACLVLGIFGGGYFLSVSLLISFWIYDRSDLYRFGWLDRIGTEAVERAVFCHAGFDDVSEALRAELGAAEWTVLDHYDPRLMTEASVRRARKLFPPTEGTIATPYDTWPVEDHCADLVFGILAIHEFRTVEERSAWFAEAKRVLAPGGKIVVVEHVRDAANFFAFGPGFLHFHSVKKWQESWEGAGLELVKTFRVTAWVRVFVLSEDE